MVLLCQLILSNDKGLSKCKYPNLPVQSLLLQAYGNITPVLSRPPVKWILPTQYNLFARTNGKLSYIQMEPPSRTIILANTPCTEQRPVFIMVFLLHCFYNSLILHRLENRTRPILTPYNGRRWCDSNLHTPACELPALPLRYGRWPVLLGPLSVLITV